MEVKIYPQKPMPFRTKIEIVAMAMCMTVLPAWAFTIIEKKHPELSKKDRGI